jgi:hypothetical protein
MALIEREIVNKIEKATPLNEKVLYKKMKNFPHNTHHIMQVILIPTYLFRMRKREWIDR